MGLFMNYNDVKLLCRFYDLEEYEIAISEGTNFKFVKGNKHYNYSDTTKCTVSRP